jgi:hypothetical protein
VSAVSKHPLYFTSLLFLDLDVLVGADTGGLEGLGAQLLILVGDQVNAGRKLVDVGALATEIEDTDLGVWHTTVEPRLRVWLGEICVSACPAASPPRRHRRMVFPPQTSSCWRCLATYLVLAVAVAPRWTACHYDGGERWMLVLREELTVTHVKYQESEGLFACRFQSNAKT